AVEKTAALPDEDFPSFLLATQLVLIDVLSRRMMPAQIAHHWPTFRGHYRAASAVDRAAIAQAFRTVGLVQDTPISIPETLADRTTAPAAGLKPLLESKLSKTLAPTSDTDPSSVAAVLIEALKSPRAAQDAADLWATHGALFAQSMGEQVLAGFRYIYEAWDGFAPDGGENIPLLDPPPGVEWPY
ncbi:MAG: hypothetical protein AAGO57_03645, partial [Pseudomonadota bacterium]